MSKMAEAINVLWDKRNVCLTEPLILIYTSKIYRMEINKLMRASFILFQAIELSKYSVYHLYGRTVVVCVYVYLYLLQGSLKV